MGFAQRLPSRGIELTVTPGIAPGIGIALDLIEQLNLRQGVVTQAGGLQPGIVELSTGMCPAANVRHVPRLPRIKQIVVAGVGIALQVAVIRRLTTRISKPAAGRGTATAQLIIVKNVRMLIIANVAPEVTRLHPPGSPAPGSVAPGTTGTRTAFAITSLAADLLFHRCLICLDYMRVKHAIFHQRQQRHAQFTEPLHPPAHARSIQVHVAATKNSFEPVQRQGVGEFTHRDVRQQTRAGDALGQTFIRLGRQQHVGQ